MPLCTIHLSNKHSWKSTMKNLSRDRTIVDPVASTNNWNQITKRSWSNYYHLSRHAFKSQLNLTHRIEIQSVVLFSRKGEKERETSSSISRKYRFNCRFSCVLILTVRILVFELRLRCTRGTLTVLLLPHRRRNEQQGDKEDLRTDKIALSREVANIQQRIRRWRNVILVIWDPLESEIFLWPSFSGQRRARDLSFSRRSRWKLSASDFGSLVVLLLFEGWRDLIKIRCFFVIIFFFFWLILF